MREATVKTDVGSAESGRSRLFDRGGGRARSGRSSKPFKP